jgi:regulatory subunit for Cdc7p protein kinase
MKRPPEESSVAGYDHLVKKAIGFGMKIWSTSKLDSVLERCLLPNTTDSTKSSSTLTSTRKIPAAPTLSTSNNANAHHRPLSQLLQSERFHGTHERDPTQKRHNFQYFSRSSYFVLVEDLRQELATVAALEYTATKGCDGKPKATWPVLHCHPYARGPFIEYDEREKRRWERSQLAESKRGAEKGNKRPLVMRKKESKMQLRPKKSGDLRRSVSMSNLHRRAAHANAMLHGMVDLDADNQDSANASGYLASTGTGGTYMAASGNSVGITSTTGTTSNVGKSLRNLQLPAALRGRIQQQVVTSRKYPVGAAAQRAQAKRDSIMGPPEQIPDRPTMLRKSRSTNTLRLPKREEGSKPGYCENCRIKFDDFKIVSSGNPSSNASHASLFPIAYPRAQAPEVCCERRQFFATRFSLVASATAHHYANRGGEGATVSRRRTRSKFPAAWA